MKKQNRFLIPGYGMLSALLAAITLLGGCAKQRPVDPLLKGDELTVTPWLAKDTLMKVPNDGDSTSSWLGKITVVRTSTDGGFTSVGFQSVAKAGHFEFTRQKLRFINDVSLYDKVSASSMNELIYQWPVKHHDKHLAVQDGNVTNKEEEDNYKTWDQKRFFAIDFSKPDVTLNAAFPYTLDEAADLKCWKPIASYVIDKSTELTNNYFTFVIDVDYQQDSLCTEDIRRGQKSDFVYSVQYRYSFERMKDNAKRADSNPNKYQPFYYKDQLGSVDQKTQEHFDPLHRKYGYFETNIENLGTKDGLFLNRAVMNRWNPKTRHDYYFATDFPPEYKWIYADPKVGVFARVNAMFKKAGLPTRFYIHENTWGDGKVKHFGDIRYSFVKIVKELDLGNGLLGYGPTDVDPFTGEILDGNVILWSGYMETEITLARLTWEAQKKAAKKNPEISSFRSALNDILKQDGQDITHLSRSFDPNSAAGQTFYDLLPQQTFGYPPYAGVTRHPISGSDGINAMLGMLKNPDSSESGLTSPSSNLFGLIRSKEATDISGYPLTSAGMFARIQEVRDQVDQERVRAQLDLNRTCLYPLAEPLEGAIAAVMDGADPKMLVNTLYYRTAIHEFGHNLNLRHNFYGSVDKRNFPAPSVALDNHGNPVLDKNGKPIMTVARTSSVMDYMNINDDAVMERNWGPYDRAALLFAYSDGKIDLGKDHTYLYCTDEDTAVNALCNQFDSGTTPSEIVTNMIRDYDTDYTFRNLRNDRAYWNTTGYADRMYGTMMKMRKFLAFLFSGMPANTIKGYLTDQKHISDPNVIAAIQKPITDDILQANRLAIAFYNAVLLEQGPDRNWNDRYEQNGQKKRIGSFYDKLFATYALMSDMPLDYDPNNPLPELSYLSIDYTSPIRPLLDRVLENSLTQRIDMPPGFIGLTRALYAATASDYQNRDDSRLLDWIRVTRFTPDGMASAFGISPDDLKNVGGFTPTESRDSYFEPGQRIDYARIDGNYYVAPSSTIPFTILEDAIKSKDVDGSSMIEPKSDLLQLYNLYRQAVGDTEP